MRGRSVPARQEEDVVRKEIACANCGGSPGTLIKRADGSYACAEDCKVQKRSQKKRQARWLAGMGMMSEMQGEAQSGG